LLVYYADFLAAARRKIGKSFLEQSTILFSKNLKKCDNKRGGNQQAVKPIEKAAMPRKKLTLSNSN
jgi:hypothetical protein